MGMDTSKPEVTSSDATW